MLATPSGPSTFKAGVPIHLSHSSFQYDGDHLASTGTTWQKQLHLLRPRAAHRLKPRLLPLLAKLLNSSPRRAGVHLVEKQLHLFGPRAPICTLGLHLGLHLAEVTPPFWEKSHMLPFVKDKMTVFTFFTLCRLLIPSAKWRALE